MACYTQLFTSCLAGPQVWIKESDASNEEFFDELPYMLRHEAVWHLVSKAMNSIPLFAGLDASVQACPHRPAAMLSPCMLRHNAV